MKAHLSIIIFIALLTMSFPVGTDAQTNTATFEIFSESGRYSLTVPDDWGASTYPTHRTHEIRFIDENLVVADTRENFDQWAYDGHTDGNLLIVRTFPVAAYQNIQTTSTNFDQRILETHLSVYYENASALGTPIFDDSGDFPSLRLETEQRTILIVKADFLIYDIAFSGDDSARLNAVADSLTIHAEPVEQFPRAPLLIDNGAFALQTEIGWLIADWGEGSLTRPFNSVFVEPTTSGIPHYYVISPSADGELFRQLFSSLFAGAVTVDLPSTYLQIAAHPFDELFGSANISLTDDDYQTLFAQMVAEVNAQFETIEQVDGLGVPAYAAQLESIFGGANRGKMLMVANNHTIYALTIAMPNDRFNQALVDAIMAGVAINTDGLGQISVEPLGPADEDAISDTEIGLQIGMTAPDFTLPLLDGSTASLSDYRGKTVLLNFWNIYCRPCRTEMPIFEQVYQSRDDVVILAVDFLDDAASVQFFADDVGLSFPIALDHSGLINHQYGIRAYPTSFVIDPQGIIRSTPRFTNAVDTTTVNEWLDTAN